MNWINKINCNILFLDIDSDAFCLPAENTVVISSKYEDVDHCQFQVAHEVAHCILKHQDMRVLYNMPVYHSKIEYEANQLALSWLIEEYIQLDLKMTVSRFMDYYGIPINLYDGCECLFYKRTFHYAVN